LGDSRNGPDLYLETTTPKGREFPVEVIAPRKIENGFSLSNGISFYSNRVSSTLDLFISSVKKNNKKTKERRRVVYF